ncbi:MAG: alpha-1,2-fucosyltransferase [Thiotrichales bacterium]
MVIVFNVSGGLCNKLWAVAPFVGYSVLQGESVVVLNFGSERVRYFVKSREGSVYFFDLFSKYPRVGHTVERKIISLLKKILGWLCKSCGIFVDGPIGGVRERDKDKGCHRLLIIDGWNSKKPLMYDRLKGEIIKYFEPIPRVASPVNKALNRMRDKNNFVVGVHIRRGDYKDYYDGRYYYSDSLYKRVMEKIKNDLDKPVIFLVCSTDSVDLSFYSELEIVQLKMGEVGDLYALSKCDYIFGPPSSFSMWASFVGGVPIRFVQSENDDVNITQFKIIGQQNKFVDGSDWLEKPV